MTHRQAQLRRIFLLALLLLVGSMLAVSGYMLWRLRVDTLNGGLQMSAMHTRGFEDFLTQSLHATEMVTANAGVQISRTHDMQQIERAFKTTLANAPFLRSMSVLDEQGRIIASSNKANLGKRIDIQAYLPTSYGPQEMLRIGQPWAGRDFADGRASSERVPVQSDESSFIPVSRSIQLGDQWITILVALNTDYFINHIAQSILSEQGEVEVLRYDGTLLLSTDAQELPGSLSLYVKDRLHLDEVEAGQFADDRSHAVPVLTSFRSSRLYPFVVVTHIKRDEALRHWQTEAKTLLGVEIPVLLMLVALAIAFYRREMQSALQQAEAERLQRINASVFEASAEAIIITDVHANIVSVNVAFTRITGFAAAEVLGKNPRLLSSGKQSAEFYQAMWRDIAKQGAWQGELVNRRKDGSLFDAYSSITVSRDTAGNIVHYIGVMSDITQRKRTELELRRSNEELYRFSEITAHHLQEPARRLASYADRLTNQLANKIEDEDTLQSLTFINAQSKRMRALLSDIELYLAAGHPRARVASTNVAKVLDRVLARFAAEISASGTRVTRGPLPAVLLDIPRLHDILEILVKNALVHAVPVAEQLHVHIEGEQRGAVVRYRVSDNGRCIEPQYRERVFRVFERLTTTGEGTGIGLAIVRRIAQSCGGSAWITESEQGGCCIYFELPAGESDAE